MKVVKWTRYGPSKVLWVGAIDTPSPKVDGFLVRVRRCASPMFVPCAARIFEECELQTTRSREG